MLKNDIREYLFAIPLTTHRDRYIENSTFLYESIIAAISILFFRTTIILSKNEPKSLRFFFGFMLAFLAYSNKSYELISTVEIFSYAVPFCLYSELPFLSTKTKTTITTTNNTNKKQQQNNNTTTTTQQKTAIILRLLLIAISAILSLLICHLVASGELFHYLNFITPNTIYDGLSLLLPIEEVQAAYDVIDRFVFEPYLLKSQIYRLLFITFHIQIGIGHLGIGFLTHEQHRRNELVRLDLKGNIDDDNDGDDDVYISSSTSSSSSATTTITDESKAVTSNNNNKKKKQNQKNKSKNSQKDRQKEEEESQQQQKQQEEKKTTTKAEKRMYHARKFQKSAFPFIFLVAAPYMIKIIFYGNINAFAFACFKDELHRQVRLYDLFDNDNHLVAMANHSPKSPNAYAGYMDTVVSTVYNLFNRKLFSLPKVVLLPTVMGRQPKLLAQIFPIIFLTDWMKGRAISYMTNRIETLQKETQELTAIRSKVEAFDIKNAELLQRAGPGASEFTRLRWEELTIQIQAKTTVKDLVARTKGFFGWIHRSFVFSVLIDCALAHLIAVEKIVTAETFVFSRAIEDAVDMVLMRSRSEAELARLMTDIESLNELSSVWDNAKSSNLLRCNLAPPSVTAHHRHHHNTTSSDSSSTVHHPEDEPLPSMIVIRNLHYSRGTASVRIDHLELTAGIYALTGANGSGKSTMFRVLMSCNTNERGISLPSSILLSTPFETLVEEDDIEREMACEDADYDEDSGEDPSCANPLAEAGDDGGDVRGLSTSETHPRLSITMPSEHVVEISQTFYWPLYAKPIDWIYHEHVPESCADEEEFELRVQRVAEALNSLEFYQSKISSDGSDESEEDVTSNSSTSDDNSPLVVDDDKNNDDDILTNIKNDLLEEKEDWFDNLSGGQKSKVELVRKVFIHDECPHVLLVDETMAPLDPSSKSLVMSKLKAFCSESVVIVIYHTDVGQEQKAKGEKGGMVECVPSNDFFDGNVHVENGMVKLRPTC